MKQQEVIYRIDRNDILLLVNEAWDAFALENDGADLTRRKVVGKSLWGFIADDDARLIYKLLTDKVRAGRKVTGLHFRCDSPSTRRFMDMDITLFNMGEVEFRCRVTKIEERDPVDLSGIDEDAYLGMCSWCKRVDIGSGQWSEIEEAVKVLNLFDREKMPLIRHRMCATCLKKLDDL